MVHNLVAARRSMVKDNLEERWRRLMVHLAPIYDQAVATARRLSRSPADGDDLFQAAVLRAFEKFHTLRDERSFRSWFYRVILSVHRNRSRRSFWRRFIPLEDREALGHEPAGEDGDRWEEDRVQAMRIARALATLPAVQREAIVLFELDDFSLEEIAALQETSLSSVKSRLARGRERLRRHYQKLGFGKTEEAGGALDRTAIEDAAAVCADVRGDVRAGLAADVPAAADRAHIRRFDGDDRASHRGGHATAIERNPASSPNSAARPRLGRALTEGGAQ